MLKAPNIKSERFKHGGCDPRLYWLAALIVGVLVGDPIWMGHYPSITNLEYWLTLKSFWPSAVLGWMGCPWARGVLQH